MSKDRQSRLQKLFRELAGKVREHLPKIDRKGFDLPIFDSITASTNTDRKARRVPPGGGGGGGGGRSSPMFGRPAEAKVEAKTEAIEEGWRIRVRITPTQNTQPRDRAVLSFAIAEDRDNGVAGDRLTPKNVLIDGYPGTVDDRVVPLGGLTRLSPVVVEATVARSSDSAKGATAGVLSVLSLKRETPPKAADANRQGPETT